MHMADWIAKLDDFLRLSDRDVLTHAGRFRIIKPRSMPTPNTKNSINSGVAWDAANTSDFDQAVRRLKDETPPKPRRRKKKD